MLGAGRAARQLAPPHPTDQGQKRVNREAGKGYPPSERGTQKGKGQRSQAVVNH